MLVGYLIQFVMENRQFFYKIGRFPSTTSVHFDDKIDIEDTHKQPDSGIEMNINHQENKELRQEHFQYMKQSLSSHPSLSKGKKKNKKCKISKESLPRSEDMANERIRINQKHQMQKLVKIRDLIKLFHEKTTLNSVLRTPVVFNPFQNIFSQQNNCFFQKLNLESHKGILNTIYIIKVIFIVLYFFIFPLTLLYKNLADSLFVFIMKFCAVGFSSFDLLQTLQRNYSVDSNNALNKEKYLHFIYQKRKKVLFQFMIILASAISLIFNHSSQANVLFITISFNVSHLAEQLHQLQDQFLTVTYINKYWNLLKVIIKNLFVCHLLACCLIALSYINKDHNWMTPNSIDQLPWYQQYIWSYYFGTTIILTIGFGDLHANNTVQAFFIIVISFFACVFFGYNINYIGNLINSIKQDENQKNTKLKLLNSLSKKSSISKNVYNQISRYIIEESKIKQQSNYGQQKKLIKQLPQSLRSSFLQQANEKLFNHLKQIIPLSNKAIQKLSLKIEARFCHPNQLIKGSQNEPSLIILQSGEIGYITRSKYPSKLKNAIIQRISNTLSSQSKLVCVDLFLDSPHNYDIKSLDYSIIYEMDKSSFQQSIMQSKKDYQIYRSILDKCKFKLNEFALVKCRFCQNKMHTLFQCPKIHYQPFRKTLPLKSIKSNINAKQQRVKFPRKKKLIQCQVIFQSKTLHQVSQSQTSRSGTITPRMPTQITERSYCQKEKTRGRSLRPSNQNVFMTIQMVGQLRNEIQNLKRNSFNNFQFNLWDNIDCDQACNFQYYFSKWNPDYIGEKKIKNTLLVKTTRIKRKPKMVNS